MSSLQWSVDDLGQDASDRPSLPGTPVALTGKFGTGGGKLVGLVVLHSTSPVCFGWVGASRAKVCVSESCSVDAHASNKFEFGEGADALAFIETGSGTHVWSKPCVPLEAFGPSWERYKFEQRNLVHSYST